MRIGPRSTVRLLLTVVIVLLGASLCMAAAAPGAQAAPANTMGLTQLQALLDNNGGTADGYFMTVLKGATPVKIDARVISIVANQSQDGALIMFDSNDATLTAIGGIASGMSGSPFYVYVDGQPDQLIGAVSYGSNFTTGGVGLATPIEYMIAIEDAYLPPPPPPSTPRSLHLAKPVATDAGAIGRIVIAPSAAQAKKIVAGPNTAVFHPLSAIQIGGLKPGGAMYKALAAKFAKLGFDVGPNPEAVAPTGYDPNFKADFAGGSALATLYSRGDMWAGAAGTVTYVDGANLLAYGHPLDWLGSTDAYLTNAWVSGVWSSSAAPSLVMLPAALHGKITQDRNSGVAGIIDAVPVDVHVHATATLGAKTSTSDAWVPQSLASNFQFAELPAYAAWVAVGEAYDSMMFPGSASTVSTVDLSDGTHDYEVKLNNLWDDPMDVASYASDDLMYILDTLTSNDDGVAPVTIKSVDLSTTLSSESRNARIVSVSVPGGLHHHTNIITTTVLAYGDRVPRTIKTSLYIPDGTPLTGMLRVYGGYSPSYDGSSDSSDGSGASVRLGAAPARAAASVRAARAATTVDDRPTVADLVKELQDTLQNNDLVVSFLPIDFTGASGPPDPNGTTIDGKTTADWVIWGGPIMMRSASMTFGAHPAQVAYGSGTVLAGSISTDSSVGVTVGIWKMRPDGTYVHVDTVPAFDDGSGGSLFMWHSPGLTQTTRFKAVWAGDATHMGATKLLVVGVKARVTLTRSPAVVRSGKVVTLHARVSPGYAGRHLTFQRWSMSRKTWITIHTVTVGKGNTATCGWRAVGTGTFRIRAVVEPSATGIGGVSAVQTVRVIR